MSELVYGSYGMSYSEWPPSSQNQAPTSRSAGYRDHIGRASVGWPSSYSTSIQAASLPSPAASVRIGPLCHHALYGLHGGCIAAGCQAPSLAQPESPWEGKCYLNVNPSNSRVPKVKCNFWTSLPDANKHTLYLHIPLNHANICNCSQIFSNKTIRKNNINPYQFPNPT